MTIGTIRINLLQEFFHIYLEFFIHGLFGNTYVCMYVCMYVCIYIYIYSLN